MVVRNQDKSIVDVEWVFSQLDTNLAEKGTFQWNRLVFLPCPCWSMVCRWQAGNESRPPPLLCGQVYAPPRQESSSWHKHQSNASFPTDPHTTISCASLSPSRARKPNPIRMSHQSWHLLSVCYFFPQAPSIPLPTHTVHHQGCFSPPTPTTASASYTPQPPSQDHGGTTHSWGYSSVGVDRSTTYPPPALPSIAVVTASTSSTMPQQHSTSSWGGATAVPSAPTVPTTDAPQHDHPSVDSSNTFPSPIANPPHESNSRGGSIYASQPYGHIHQSIQLPTHLPPPPVPYGALRNSMGPPTTPSSSNEKNSYGTPSTPAPLITSYPPKQSSRSTYTRTLVGPLSANATRLKDEHRKLGIFFLFQDLSVRTEGTFRLRMRLMNVGA